MPLDGAAQCFPGDEVQGASQGEAADLMDFAGHGSGDALRPAGGNHGPPRLVADDHPVPMRDATLR